MQPASARHTTLTIPTYLRQPERQLPYIFRDDWMNSYPDRHDDILGGPKVQKEYAAIVLENEFLRLTVLPELGGKLFSVFDKQAQQESVYVPDCIKPGLIHRPGAWIPGGMEFNFPIGHHMRTMRPLPCAILKTGPDEAVALVERLCARTGLRMELRITLKAGEARFTIGGEMFNPTLLRHRYYQWTNVGCWQHDQWRFFSKATHYHTGNRLHEYPLGDDGVDISWVENRPVPSDSFMVAHQEDFFGCYDYKREHGLCHVAPWRELAGKKYFTWGTAFREYNSEVNLCDDGRNYLEIQTGPLETQMDYEILEPGQSRRWTSTWIPFGKLGGIEWANRDLIFYVRDGVPAVYCAAAQQVELRIGGATHALSLKAGEFRRLPGGIHTGDRVAIEIGGVLQREFAFPLEGRQEPGGAERWAKQNYWAPLPPKPTADDHFAMGERHVKNGNFTYAIGQFEAALALKAGHHEARFALADSHWHIGDFARGAAEFKKLLKTPLGERARLQLARQAAAEAAFLAPVQEIPTGPARDLALAERLAGYGGFAAAYKLYAKLLQIDPKNVRVHYGLAMYFHYAKGQNTRALKHVEMAFKLQPHDRDLILELTPILMACGRFPRARQVIEAAPAAIRNLSNVVKYLEKVYFELGEDTRAQAIGAKAHHFIWEGEFAQADTFMDATLALVQAALAKGDLAAARKWLPLPWQWPVGLGLKRRYLNQPKPGYWAGRIAELSGQPDEAQKIWCATAVEFNTELKLIDQVHGNIWRQWLSPQIAYLNALCADKSGDAGLKQQALELFKELARPELLPGKQGRKTRPAAGGKKPEAPHPLRDGLLAELAGDFQAAKKHLAAVVKQMPAQRLVRMHLQAVMQGRRFGE